MFLFSRLTIFFSVLSANFLCIFQNKSSAKSGRAEGVARPPVLVVCVSLGRNALSPPLRPPALKMFRAAGGHRSIFGWRAGRNCPRLRLSASLPSLLQLSKKLFNFVFNETFSDTGLSALSVVGSMMKEGGGGNGFADFDYMHHMMQPLHLGKCAPMRILNRAHLQPSVVTLHTAVRNVICRRRALLHHRLRPRDPDRLMMGS